ncbi:bifunctional SWAP-Surp/Splicing factor 3A subunit 1 [Babesia duncani]|uniref:Bifunctional SWAP-Surp/Splicing factor 3A subunit 1 n=1 Tax=Babesia duncani TaxID=323732 RepID=A0AAD9UP94_9APIC|nr:bifunctional SWAP-Surp/Splicing factor 3A subunit 1 [Babesia duncani]KAK2196645.1 bifunctional SWAP-Surp/Splicing factor 3A subunit 1 [Babesia duncani]KAK2196647.1 bifunctional SWAP-Surp/Splicing factor 3A subunit 1 [Babesia duncani]
MSSLSIDIIYPPSHIRSVIDKTAQFVAKNGEQFESKIRNDQSGNTSAHGAKFAFLNPFNAYHSYYKLKLSEIRKGIVVDSQPSIPQAILDKREKLELKNRSKEKLLALSDFHSLGPTVDVAEPEEDVFSYIQPYISSLDMDIIKTTALFIARNGQKFLTELNKRERNNPQFDFLNPSHHLFSLLTTLTESFSRCLLPPKAQIEKLTSIAQDRMQYINTCQRRADWESKKAAKLEAEAARRAAEKEELNSIEWHSFFIAETIELNDFNNDLPKPLDLSRPGIISTLRSGKIVDRPMDEASIADEHFEGLRDSCNLINEVGVDAVAIEIAGATDDPADISLPKFSDAPKLFTKRKTVGEGDTKIIQDGDEIIKVKKSYTRKNKGSSTNAMQKCPITGQLVPASEMAAHLQILLLDPKWKKQKDQFMEKALKESAFAPMEDIDRNLASFVAGRPDLFGSADDEANF